MVEHWRACLLFSCGSCINMPYEAQRDCIMLCVGGETCGSFCSYSVCEHEHSKIVQTQFHPS